MRISLNLSPSLSLGAWDREVYILFYAVKIQIDFYLKKAIIQSSSANDLSDLNDLIYLTAEEMRQFSLNVNDLVIECTHNRINCDKKQDFVQIYNQQYGFCYTFNGKLERNELKNQ